MPLAGAAYQSFASLRIESPAKIPECFFVNRRAAADKTGAARPPRPIAVTGIVIVTGFRACLPVGILGIVGAGSAAATEGMKGRRHSASAERYRQIFSRGSLGPAPRRPTNTPSSQEPN